MLMAALEMLVGISLAMYKDPRKKLRRSTSKSNADNINCSMFASRDPQSKEGTSGAKGEQ